MKSKITSLIILCTLVLTSSCTKSGKLAKRLVGIWNIDM